MPSQSSHLPIRRVYDIKCNRILETIKFNGNSSHYNCEPSQKDSNVKVDVKICALSYPTDFHHQLYNVVPSKRIIVKKHSFESHNKTRRVKFLVYPYTTCHLEGIHNDSHCCCSLTYGEDLDGGLQESLYVPKQLLIPIPQNVSLHDVCFIWDIILPFYVYSTYITNQTCILLNDIKREINEVLIILNHLNIDQRAITILDETTMSLKYADKFDTVFCFNSKLAQFAEFCCQPPTAALALIHKRQRLSKILTNFPIVAKSSDKTYHYMKLGYDDEKSCIELLQIIRDLNNNRSGYQGLNDSTTQPRNNSTTTTVSSSSASTSDANSLRQEHMDNKSVTTTSNSSRELHSKGHCTWFWSDEDVDLTNYSDLSLEMDQSFDDDEERGDVNDDYESRVVHDMNKKLNSSKPHRVCYFNRKIKPSVNVSII